MDLPSQDNTLEFFNSTINTAKNNLTNIVNGLDASGEGVNADIGLRVAAIQVETAKAIGLAMVTQQLAEVAQAVKNLRGSL